jgi:hypothetical protein
MTNPRPNTPTPAVRHDADGSASWRARSSGTAVVLDVASLAADATGVRAFRSAPAAEPPRCEPSS